MIFDQAPEIDPTASPPQVCPLCGGVKTTTLYTLPDPAFVTARCDACRFVFMSPYPTDAFLNAYYASRELYGLSGNDPDAYRQSIGDRVVLFRKLFRKNRLPLRAGFAVDFGAGMGIAVAALKQLGFDAIGIEKNPQAAAVGKAGSSHLAEDGSCEVIRPS
jgi:hypothetical protein